MWKLLLCVLQKEEGSKDPVNELPDTNSPPRDFTHNDALIASSIAMAGIVSGAF